MFQQFIINLLVTNIESIVPDSLEDIHEIMNTLMTKERICHLLKPINKRVDNKAVGFLSLDDILSKKIHILRIYKLLTFIILILIATNLCCLTV
ncbi:hypothetical protein B5S50_04925 [Clostridium sp. 001]|nr:hypothetical protein B5S50_04925 [Clostridium sp. 001]